MAKLGNSNIITLNEGSGVVNINSKGGTKLTGELHIKDGDSSTAGNVQLKITGTQTNTLANGSPDIVFERQPNDGNVAVDNYLGEITWKGLSDDGTNGNYGFLKVLAKDVTDNAEKANMIFQIAAGGAGTEQALAIRGNGTVVDKPNVQLKNGPLVYAEPETLAIDDTTPSVAGGNMFKSAENSVASSHVTVTQLDDGYVGQIVTIYSGHATNAIQIDDGGNFALSANWDPDGVAETITLGCWVLNKWTEISRSDNA
jgi:hypothetical protein